MSNGKFDLESTYSSSALFEYVKKLKAYYNYQRLRLKNTQHECPWMQMRCTYILSILYINAICDCILILSLRKDYALDNISKPQIFKTCMILRLGEAHRNCLYMPYMEPFKSFFKGLTPISLNPFPTHSRVHTHG